jgi:Lrp/AsnC family transcriptional regulator
MNVYSGKIMQKPLDDTDIAILSILQRDASVAVAEIAKSVGLAQSPCWRRIQRLQQTGVIRANVALLERRMLGLNLEVFVEIRFLREEPEALRKFEDAIRKAPEIIECFMLMGEVDFLLRVLTRDVDHYERFLRETLAVLPGVRDINSSIAISAVKSSTEIPLESARPQTASRAG